MQHSVLNYRERKQNRFKGFDYSQDGWYFVTICTKNRKEIFGDIENDKIILNNYGKIAYKYWLEIVDHYKNVQLDEFIVMQNHIHGIIAIINEQCVGCRDRTMFCPYGKDKTIWFIIKNRKIIQRGMHKIYS